MSEDKIQKLEAFRDQLIKRHENIENYLILHDSKDVDPPINAKEYQRYSFLYLEKCNLNCLIITLNRRIEFERNNK